MTRRDWFTHNHLQIIFDALGNPLAEGQRGFVAFLEALETHAGELMPTTVKGKRRRKYSRDNVDKSFAEKCEQAEFGPNGSVNFDRPPSPEVSLYVFASGHSNQLGVNLDVLPFSFFQEPAHAAARSQRLVDLMRAWALHYPPIYAIAHDAADVEISRDPNYTLDANLKTAEFNNVYDAYWLNIIGAKLVGQLGRERVLSTPAHHLEALPNGSVLFLTRPTIADFASEEARLAQARSLVHLRPELKLEEVLARKREQSAALAPVEARFHPDIADVLAHLIEYLPLSQRPRKIAELNAYRPPEVTEWLPRERALPSDAPDPDAVIRAVSQQAEYLVALTHSDLESVFKGGPESLPDVDGWFFQNYRYYEGDRQTLDDLILPAVGGYLGEVMVRNLGGKWLPRRRYGEVQVLVGERVWFPFIRAHRYLRSRQSLVDYSLTQFYRAAEQHLRSLGR